MGTEEDVDVFLDVPHLGVEALELDVDDLRATVDLHARVLDLARASLNIRGVEAQALLKVRLARVAAILDRVMQTIDRNPQILERLVGSLGEAVETVGRGTGRAVTGIGEGAAGALEATGEGAAGALEATGKVVEGVVPAPRAGDRRARVTPDPFSAPDPLSAPDPFSAPLRPGRPKPPRPKVTPRCSS
jgi:hypothetical protein